MANDTKERILEAALEMFSQNGYAGTNIRELTASLGLVKSSMYKHFESKEAIWNALLDQMIAYYNNRFGSAEHLPPVPDSMEDLVQMTLRMVNLTVHDDKIVMTRKVLAIEHPAPGLADAVLRGAVGHLRDRHHRRVQRAGRRGRGLGHVGGLGHR